MGETARILERQAAWQRAQRDLPWPEKLRMAAAARTTLLAFVKLREAEAERRSSDPPWSQPNGRY